MEPQGICLVRLLSNGHGDMRTLAIIQRARSKELRHAAGPYSCAVNLRNSAAPLSCTTQLQGVSFTRSVSRRLVVWQ